MKFSKMKNLLSMTLLILGVIGNLEAQNNTSSILTLDEAVSKALTKNNNVLIAKNNTEIARQQNTKGNAGYLPTVNVNSNYNMGINNTTLQFLNSPDPQKIDAARNTSYGTNVTANYTIFGGLGNFYSKKNLNLSEQNAEIQERLNIESIILQLVQSYCQVLQAQNNYVLTKKSLSISKERITRAKTKFEISGGTKLELLNAEVDYNSDSINLINTINNLNSAKIRLRQLINEPDMGEFSVAPVPIEEGSAVNLDELKNAAKENNASLLNANYNEVIASNQINMNRSGLLPRLSLQGNYNFNHSENDASFVLFNESSGFSGALQLSIPIFDGHKKTIQYQNAQVRAKNAELSKQEALTGLERDFNIAYSNYQTAKSIASLDQKSLETAKLNFERTQELFNNGQATGLQFREAQLNLLRVESQAVNNKINVKLAEVELIRLSGTLIR